MFPAWKGRIVYPREDAQREMTRCRLDLYDIVSILDDPEAFDCEEGRRKEHTIVKCVRRGKKVLKVVVEDSVISLGDSLYPAWRIRHVGEARK